MGKRGPRSKNAQGYGNITSKGYRRITCPVQRRERMEHVVVWEAANGHLPIGFQVHHINEDKLDNRLENLVALSMTDHKRVHGRCEMRDGEWWKPCRKCGTMRHIADYYKRKSGVSPWCKPCCIESAVANKKLRRARGA